MGSVGMNVKEKDVFISGVSSGLGQALAEWALDAGATVWGVSRRQPEPLIARGLRWMELDLQSVEGREKAVRETFGEVVRWEVVWLNAGMLPPMADMRETPLATMREVMEVNVWGQKWLLDQLLMEAETVGSVVAISSGASQSGSRGWNGYAVSKAALNMLIKLYAVECPEVHFAALAPGMVESAMQDYLQGVHDARFATLDRHRAAQQTPTMQTATLAAKRCWEAVPHLRQVASGSYANLRELT